MLRFLHETDLAAILKVETTTHLLPWTAETFMACFHLGCLGWVIEIEQEIVAFILITLRAKECHILNLCVLPHFQRQKHGEALLTSVINFAANEGANIIYLEVRESNEAAIKLYQKMDFFQVGIRKNYYPNGATFEHALVFAKYLNEKR